MIFEAATTIAPGTGLSARLDGSTGRVELDAQGNVCPFRMAATVPRLIQLLADKAQCQVIHAGRVYLPGPAPDSLTEWGEAC
jgi:hypothetical protein